MEDRLMAHLRGCLRLGKALLTRVSDWGGIARLAPSGHDLAGCLTNEDLARLFERAFGTWQEGQAEQKCRRQTPRIKADVAKPIFLVSYAYDGREVELNRRAYVVDISADGLGIALPDPLPVGAVACFAFDGLTGMRNYGAALVVRSASHEDGFRIGLSFAESAQSLELGEPAMEAAVCRATLKGCEQGFERLRERACAAYRTVTQRHHARKILETSVYDRKASFIVEAKLFRYTAALVVEGREVVRRTGALRARLQNLFCEAAKPTLIHLQGGGFAAWATVQANEVTDCSLDISLPLKQRIHAKFL
jgi:hypothetical protein